MTTPTVLVIEDNAKNMKLVRLLLQMENFRVLEAVNAEKGIALARQDRPDLILMDIQLPGMDGLQATGLIKADPQLGAIPVVALTSYAMEGDKACALEAGCDGYITKPIDTESFIDIIRTYIRPPSGDDAPRQKARHDNAVRILIVDDDPKNVKLMCGMLNREDYELWTAADGPSALERVQESPLDLILLDVMMPGMDGYEVTRRLKAGDETKAIPIILITALDGPEDRARGLEAGAEEFLTKPVNPVEIEARIQSMLKLKRYRDQLAIRACSEDQTCSDVAAVAPPKPADNQQRILIVEDDPKDLKLLQSHLNSSEYTTDFVRNGSDAIEAISRQHFDLILLDILLPGMDGFEICRRIKQMDDARDTQVVLITCLNDMENKIRGVELGADDYLIKPIEPRELQARVKVLLKKKAYLDSLHAHYEKALNSALLDGLTGIYNHAYLKRFLDLEIKRSQRQGHSTSLLMIDLDNFKQINDNLGHMAGDAILREVARRVKASIREIDVAARYGGEEFAVVLPYGDSKALRKVGERIRRLIEDQPFLVPGREDDQRVTVSVGGAVYPTDAATVEALIDTADRMLYQAKREGKNRVVIFATAAPAQRELTLNH
ncbi:MAG: response regulator [Desulfobacterales bacterium]|jgi:two-component system cell cycle response regulator